MSAEERVHFCQVGQLCGGFSLFRVDAVPPAQPAASSRAAERSQPKVKAHAYRKEAYVYRSV